MNLGGLLDRVYYILGDHRQTPRWFERQRIVDLLNQACLKFRAAVEDEWYTADQDITSGTDTYSYLDGHLRTQRIAYKDETLTPRGVLGVLSGQDERWQSHTGAEPLYWTSDGLPHNQYRVIPVPSTTSAQSWSFSQEFGDIVVTSDSSGAYAFSQEYGAVLALSGFSATDERGVITSVSEQGADVLTVWGTVSSPSMASDGDAVPIKQAYANAAVWYACWQIYEEETDHHNGVLAGFYKKLWEQDLESAKNLAEVPFPRMVNTIGPSRHGAPGFCIRPSDTISTSGGNITVTW